MVLALSIAEEKLGSHARGAPEYAASMPSVVLLTGGHQLEVLADPEEAERVLGDAHKTSSGFATIETPAGAAFLRPEHVVGIESPDPM